MSHNHPDSWSSSLKSLLSPPSPTYNHYENKNILSRSRHLRRHPGDDKFCLCAISHVVETTRRPTLPSAGTITEYSPDTIVIRSETSPQPLRYTYSKTTTYVDEAGNPVSMEVVKSGLPVTVQYTRDGERLIASRVIVRRHVTHETVVPAAPAIEERKTTTM